MEENCFVSRCLEQAESASSYAALRKCVLSWPVSGGMLRQKLSVLHGTAGRNSYSLLVQKKALPEQRFSMLRKKSYSSSDFFFVAFFLEAASSLTN
jgi:hypothetical protein